ncbi:UNVERIFIED_CONTAM: riboflavin synthase alpha chain [Acetivibrio alkalicellulosi]
MFTGIIEEKGVVKEIIQGRMSIKLTVKCVKIMDDVKVGDSIAVNGICLTVTSLLGTGFTADVMPETMRKTNLGSLRVGETVNLERALKLGDRLDGHIVSGHVDGTGIVSDRIEEDNAIWIEITAHCQVLKYIVLKGSVALDGTSLTVSYIDEKCFRVSLIPLTAQVTTLNEKKVGDKINIECDMLAKYIEKLVYGRNEDNSNTPKKELDMLFLKENGFA